MDFSMIIIMAILVEGVVSYAKTWVVERKIKWQQIAAVVFGILIAVAYNLDIPALVGLKTAIPFLGQMFTGILISRGSNYIYDLFKTVKSKVSESEKKENEI